MAVLLWLLIPLAGSLIASLWSAWASRRRTGVGGIHDSAGVRRYEAFRAAMERPTLGAVGRVGVADAAETGPRPASAPGPAPGSGRGSEQGAAPAPVTSTPVSPSPVVLSVRSPARADG